MLNFRRERSQRSLFDSLPAKDYVDFLEAKYITHADVPPTQQLRALLVRQSIGSGTMSVDQLARLVEAFPNQRALLDLFMALNFRYKLAAILDALPPDMAGTAGLIPITCTVRLKSPNAMAALTPLGEPFIVVDSRFAVALHVTLKLLAQLMSVDGRKNSDLEFDHTQLVRELHDVASYVFGGEREYLPGIKLSDSPQVKMWHMILLHGVETFLVCHELAHHILGHQGTIIEPFHGQTVSLGARIVSRSQGEELEADILGADIALAVFEVYRDKNRATQFHVPFTFAREIFASPHIFCSLVDLWERLWGRQWSPYDEHPTGTSVATTLGLCFTTACRTTFTNFANSVQATLDAVPDG